jgi:hypothetical protein
MPVTPATFITSRRCALASLGLATLGLVICRGGSRAPDPAPAPALTRAPAAASAPGRTPPRPQIAPTAPTDAGVEPPELDEVDDPHPLLFREVKIGFVVARPLRETAILRRAGDLASLRVILEGHASSRKPRQYPDAWSVENTETFVGRMQRRGARTVMALHSAAGRSLTLTCQSRRLSIHRARAQIVRKPNWGENCVDSGMWQPAATHTVDVQSCSFDRRDLEHLNGLYSTTWPLSASPGVELLEIASDCALEGSGYRTLVD